MSKNISRDKQIEYLNLRFVNATDELLSFYKLGMLDSSVNIEKEVLEEFKKEMIENIALNCHNAEEVKEDIEAFKSLYHRFGEVHEKTEKPITDMLKEKILSLGVYNHFTIPKEHKTFFANVKNIAAYINDEKKNIDIEKTTSEVNEFLRSVDSKQRINYENTQLIKKMYDALNKIPLF